MAPPKQIELSETRRREALDHIERAGRCRNDGDDEGARQQLEEARKALEAALEVCPVNHRARFLLVSCLMSSEDYTKAKSEALYIHKALSQDQLKGMEDPLLHLSLVQACKMLGDLGDAIYFAEEATLLYPSDPQPFVVLGELLQRRGDHTRAEESLSEALMRTDDPICRHPLSSENLLFALCSLAHNLVRLGKFAEAEKFAVRGVQLNSDSPLALKQLAEVYYCQGRLPEALQIIRRAARSDPTDEEVKERVAVLERCTEGHGHGTASGGVTPPPAEGPSMGLSAGPSFRGSPRNSISAATPQPGGRDKDGLAAAPRGRERGNDCMVCCLER